MAKGKAKTIAIKLVSTAGTGFFYATTKNPRNVPAKLSLKKVCTAVSLNIFTEGTFLIVSLFLLLPV